MIKFYKGNYADLSGKFADGNAICFCSDRGVLVMGTKEYGKDQFKSGDVATLSANAPEGMLIFDEATQTLYKKGASAVSVVLPSVSGQVAALEAKVSPAFAAGKVVLGTTTGITSSNFVPDTTAGTLDIANGTAADLSSTLVNAATLKTQIATVNASKATIVSGNGIDVSSGTANDGGIQWTVAAQIDTTSAAPFKFTNGKLDSDLTIVQLDEAQTGYAASYQLQNSAGHVFGATINIVKDQFLKSASLAYGTETGGVVTEITDGSQTAAANRYLKLVFDVNTDGDATDEESQNIVYINVNELFDSYTSGDGITVNPATNTIAINIDSTNNEKDSSNNDYLTVGSNGLKVTGINAAIDADIQALGQTTITTGQYLTQVGVNSTGNLTGTTAQVSAGQVAFTATGTIAATDVQTAIAEVATDAADALTAKVATLSASEAGGTGKYITTISETDGIITAAAADLTASAVKYGSDSTVDAAIGAISGAVAALDLTEVGGGSAPSAGTSNKYSIINTVSQADGKVAAAPIDLTAANVYQDGITEALVGTTAANARVAFAQGSQASVNDTISNILADYLSFHDKDGKLL